MIGAGRYIGLAGGRGGILFAVIDRVGDIVDWILRRPRYGWPN